MVLNWSTNNFLIILQAKILTMKNILFLSLSVIVLLTTFSCSNNDDSNNNSGNAVFKATINGEQWEASVFEDSNGLIQSVSTKDQLFQLTGSSNGIRLRVSLSATEISDCMAVGSYEFPNRVDISYATASGGWYGGHFYDIDDQGNRVMTLTVTSCSNNTISGTFSGSYTGDSGPDSPTNIEITNGVFQNIEFDITQI